MQVADSKFLKAESLLELVKAAMWASGPVMRIAASGERSDIAEVLPRVKYACYLLPDVRDHLGNNACSLRRKASR